MMSIPIILFAYNRPDHLRRTLDCLRENRVPLIYAFSDGPRTPDKVFAVSKVHEMLRAIDWCEVVLCERETNMGLGRSILAGVTKVFEKHEAAIIFEDDLICVPGTYEYLCKALNQYRDDNRVMSVTGWTHPLVTPGDVSAMPYFDGRAESWVWGTWARAWQGMMEQDASTLMHKCEERGIDVYRYGADMPAMAEVELGKNIWCVRFMYLHMLNQGFCLRPPWSMVEHFGFDEQGTNATEAGIWVASPLRPCPSMPKQWPYSMEHPECPELWQRCYGTRPTLLKSLYRFVRRLASKTLRLVSVK